MSDTKKEPGCGWTNERLWKTLVDESSKQYLAQLEQLPRLSGRSRNDLAAGFRDGMRAARLHLEGMGVMTVMPGGADANALLQPDDET